MAATPALRRAVLFDHAMTAQFLGSMLVLDAGGNIILDSANDVPRQAISATANTLRFTGTIRTPGFTSAIRLRPPARRLAQRGTTRACRIRTARSAALR